MSKAVSKNNRLRLKSLRAERISRERRERRDRATTGLDLVSLWFLGHDEGARGAESTTAGMIR